MLNIYKNLKNLFFLGCIGFIWQSCNVINPVEPIPTYIHIDSFHFVPSPAWPQLPITHQITNVWVYYNDNPVGAFDLPCTVPIIASGTESVTLYPGITIDGLNDYTGIYPFYISDTFTLAPQPGKTITRAPTTEFYGDIVQKWISNFIGTSNFTWVGGDRPITVVNNDSLVESKGGWSGSILLTSAIDSSVNSSNDTFSVPYGGNAYVEFDYKCNIPFYVGLSANLSTLITSTPYYLAGVYPSATWQKFYLEISEFNNQYQGTSYNFYIKASMPPDSTYGRVLIENIQLITF